MRVLAALLCVRAHRSGGPRRAHRRDPRAGGAHRAEEGAAGAEQGGGVRIPKREELLILLFGGIVAVSPVLASRCDDHVREHPEEGEVGGGRDEAENETPAEDLTLVCGVTGFQPLACFEKVGDGSKPLIDAHVEAEQEDEQATNRQDDGKGQLLVDLWVPIGKKGDSTRSTDCERSNKRFPNCHAHPPVLDAPFTGGAGLGAYTVGARTLGGGAGRVGQVLATCAA